MKKLLSIVLSLLMLISAGLVAVPVTAEEPAPAPAAYAYTPGLAAWYSGTQNTRAGEDTASAVWEDLINGYDLPVKTSGKTYFNEEGLVLESSQHYFPKEVVDIVNGDAFTVEILLGEFVSIGGDFNTFMNSTNDNFALFRRNSNDNLEFKWAGVAGTSRPMCDGGLAKLQNSLVTVTYEVGGDVTIYVNGQNVASKPCTQAMGADDLFIGHINNKAYKTTYKSMRFYTKCLSDAEVKRNAAVDGYGTLKELYVQDGLAAMYLGAQNTRAGENLSSTVWEDLVNGYDVAVKTNDKNYFTPEGFHLNTAVNHFPKEVVDVINGNEFTVELSLGALESIGTAYNTFLNSSNDAFSLFRRNQNDVLEFKFASNAAGGRPTVADGLNLFADSTVAITYRVGSKVTVYVDGCLMAEVPCPSAMGAGDFFFGHDKTTHNFDTVYRAMRFYNRELTAEEVGKNARADGVYKAQADKPKTPGYVTVAQPVTHVVGDVALVREINSVAELDTVMKGKVLPSTVIVYLNSKLEVTDENGKKLMTLDALLEKLDWSVMPAFVLADQAVIAPLADYLNAAKFHDCAVMSKDAGLVAAARQAIPEARGIIDYTETYKDSAALTKEECIAIRKHLHTNMGTIALLPQNAAAKGSVQYLYDSIVNVWVRTADKPSAGLIADAVLSGAVGVVSDDTAGLYQFAGVDLPANTLTRAPLNIGHRGLPSSYPENTVEGSLAGYESGADVIEIDIYVTKDGNLAVMHDGSSGRTCNKDLSIEGSTLADLQALLVNKGFENNAQKNSFHLPSFEDYLKAFKGKDCRIFIEIKSTNPKTVPLMKEQIEQYDMYDQCAVITFHESQLQNLRKYYPEMSGGFLCGSYMGEFNPDADMRNVMSVIGKTNATLNPSFSGYGEKAIRAALVRGIAIYPWTFDASSFNNYFKWGYSGLTGNNADAFKRYIKTVTVTGAENGTAFNVGDTVDLTVTGTTYARKDSNDTANAVFTLVEGADIASIENGKLTFTGAGTVTLLVSVQNSKRVLDYTVYAAPLTFTVNAPETQPDATEPATEPIAEPETQPGADTAADTAADETATSTETAADGTAAESETGTAEGGCKSVLSGLSVLALIALLGTAVIRRKQD